MKFAKVFSLKVSRYMVVRVSSTRGGRESPPRPPPPSPQAVNLKSLTVSLYHSLDTAYKFVIYLRV